ncbi:hypothetical protein GBAR_LOCUS16611 [Geodia barretti]|uniref:Uncharacterized protein n=1 Tax=Geodia barretti TaxID=519541 RepID=A0AA35SFV6_GEOBA|nr:hypothetical protein GBAR_LOCUS16611 [Geodia barretti]
MSCEAPAALLTLLSLPSFYIVYF